MSGTRSSFSRRRFHALATLRAYGRAGLSGAHVQRGGERLRELMTFIEPMLYCCCEAG